MSVTERLAGPFWRFTAWLFGRSKPNPVAPADEDPPPVYVDQKVAEGIAEWGGGWLYDTYYPNPKALLQAKRYYEAQLNDRTTRDYEFRRWLTTDR